MSWPPRPQLLALLDACKERPKDDAPRLVLADWLGEFGGSHDAARAELIRLQLQHSMGGFLSLLSRTPADPAPEEELRREDEAAWVAPLAPLLGADRRVGFYRGLLSLSLPHGALESAETERLAG